MGVVEYEMDPDSWEAVARYLGYSRHTVIFKKVDAYLSQEYGLHHTWAYCYESTDPEKLVEFVLRWG